MLKKIHTCPSINKSTERRPRVLHYQSAILSTNAACIITSARSQGQGYAKSCAVRFSALKTRHMARHTTLSSVDAFALAPICVRPEKGKSSSYRNVCPQLALLS